MRYVGRPFMSLYESRWRRYLPGLDDAAGNAVAEQRRHIIGFEPPELEKFHLAANKVISAQWHIYPTLKTNAPYFQRRTNRVVFQMTSGHALINWFAAEFPVQILYLIRHPISNALSIMNAGWQPECFEFLSHQGFTNTYLTQQQLREANAIEQHGSLLQRHVLDWSLKNLVPLRALAHTSPPNWCTTSYEALTLHREQELTRIAGHLGLEHIELMMQQANRPSRTVSDATIREVNNTDYLINRWRERVSPDQEKDLLAILELFGLNTYNIGENLPTTNHYHQEGGAKSLLSNP